MATDWEGDALIRDNSDDELDTRLQEYKNERRSFLRKSLTKPAEEEEPRESRACAHLEAGLTESEVATSNENEGELCKSTVDGADTLAINDNNNVGKETTGIDDNTEGSPDESPETVAASVGDGDSLAIVSQVDAGGNSSKISPPEQEDINCSNGRLDEIKRLATVYRNSVMPSMHSLPITASMIKHFSSIMGDVERTPIIFEELQESSAASIKMLAVYSDDPMASIKWNPFAFRVTDVSDDQQAGKHQEIGLVWCIKDAIKLRNELISAMSKDEDVIVYASEGAKQLGHDVLLILNTRLDDDKSSCINNLKKYYVEKKTVSSRLLGKLIDLDLDPEVLEVLMKKDKAVVDSPLIMSLAGKSVMEIIITACESLAQTLCNRMAQLTDLLAFTRDSERTNVASMEFRMMGNPSESLLRMKILKNFTLSLNGFLAIVTLQHQVTKSDDEGCRCWLSCAISVSLLPERLMTYFGGIAGRNLLSLYPADPAWSRFTEDVGYGIIINSDKWDLVSDPQDYVLSQMSELLPMMALAGASALLPEASRASERILHAIRRSSLSLCKYTEALVASDMNILFNGYYKISLIGNMLISEGEKVASILVQHLQWAAPFSFRQINVGITADDERQIVSGRLASLMELPKLAMIIWAASHSVDSLEDFCSLGYSHVIEILLLNNLTKPSDHFFGCKHWEWVAGILSCSSDPVKEDNKIISNSIKLGVELFPSECKALGACMSVAEKISLIFTAERRIAKRLMDKRLAVPLSQGAVMKAYALIVTEASKRDVSSFDFSDLGRIKDKLLSSMKEQGRLQDSVIADLERKFANAESDIIRSFEMLDNGLGLAPHELLVLDELVNLKDYLENTTSASKKKRMTKAASASYQQKILSAGLKEVADSDRMFFNTADKAMMISSYEYAGVPETSMRLPLNRQTTKVLSSEAICGQNIGIVSSTYESRLSSGESSTLTINGNEIFKIAISNGKEEFSNGAAQHQAKWSVRMLRGFSFGCMLETRYDYGAFREAIQELLGRRTTTSKLMGLPQGSTLFKNSTMEEDEIEIKPVWDAKEGFRDYFEKYMSAARDEYAHLVDIRRSDGSEVKGFERNFILIFSSLPVFTSAGFITLRRVVDGVWDAAVCLINYISTIDEKMLVGSNNSYVTSSRYVGCMAASAFKGIAIAPVMFYRVTTDSSLSFLISVSETARVISVKHAGSVASLMVDYATCLKVLSREIAVESVVNDDVFRSSYGPNMLSYVLGYKGPQQLLLRIVTRQFFQTQASGFFWFRQSCRLFSLVVSAIARPITLTGSFISSRLATLLKKMATVTVPLLKKIVEGARRAQPILTTVVTAAAKTVAFPFKMCSALSEKCGCLPTRLCKYSASMIKRLMAKFSWFGRVCRRYDSIIGAFRRKSRSIGESVIKGTRKGGFLVARRNNRKVVEMKEMPSSLSESAGAGGRSDNRWADDVEDMEIKSTANIEELDDAMDMKKRMEQFASTSASTSKNESKPEEKTGVKPEDIQRMMKNIHACLAASRQRNKERREKEEAERAKEEMEKMEVEMNTEEEAEADRWSSDPETIVSSRANAYAMDCSTDSFTSYSSGYEAASPSEKERRRLDELSPTALLNGTGRKYFGVKMPGHISKPEHSLKKYMSRQKRLRRAEKELAAARKVKREADARYNKAYTAHRRAMEKARPDRFSSWDPEELVLAAARRLSLDSSESSKTQDIDSIPCGASISSLLFSESMQALKFTLKSGYDNAVARKKEQEAKARLSGVKLTDKTATSESVVADLLSGRVGCCKKHSLTECWNVYSKGICLNFDSKSCEEAEAFKVEILSKKHVVIHNCFDNFEVLEADRDMFIVDGVGFSVFSLPDDGSLADAVERLRVINNSPASSKAKWSSDINAFNMTSCASEWNSTTVGISSLVQNLDINVEAVVVPGHLWMYGAELTSFNNRDQLMCLANCGTDTELPMTAEERGKYRNKELRTAMIQAKEVLRSASTKFCFVIAEARNWKGRSGSAIVDKDGAFIGICMSQIYVGGNYSILGGVSMLVACTDMTDNVSMLGTFGARLETCSELRSRIGGEGVVLSEDTELGFNTSGFKSAEVSRGFLGRAMDVACSMIPIWGQDKPAKEQEPPAKEADECGSPKSGSRTSDSGEIDEVIIIDASDVDRTPMRPEISSEEDYRSANEDASSENSSTSEDHYNNVKAICSDSSSVKENKSSELSSSPTGALEESVKVLVSSNEKADSMMSGPMKIIVNNLTEVLYFFPEPVISELSRKVLEAVLESIVKRNQVWFLCTETTMFASMSLLLSAFRVKYSVIRNLSQYRRRVGGPSEEVEDNVTLIAFEDLACWAILDGLDYFKTCNLKHRAIVLRPDGDMDASLSAMAVKLMSMSFPEMTIYCYDGRSDESCMLVDDKGIKCTYAENETTTTMQSTGLLLKLSISSSATENRRSDSSSTASSPFKVAAVDFCSSYGLSNQTRSKEVLCGRDSIHPSVVMPACYSTITHTAVWDIAKQCSTIYVHTGLFADCSREKIANVLVVRSPSIPCVNMIKEAIRVSAFVMDDLDIFSTIKITSSVLQTAGPNYSTDRPFCQMKLRKSTSKVDTDFNSLCAKVSLLTVEGMSLGKKDCRLDQSFSQVVATDCIKMLKVRDVDAINLEVVVTKAELFDWVAAFSNKIKNVTASLRWAAFKFTTGCEQYLVRAYRRVALSLRMRTMGVRNFVSKLGNKIARWVKRFRAIRRNLGMESVSTAFGSQMENCSISSKIRRLAGIGYIASCVKKLNKRKFSNEQRTMNGAKGALCWVAIEIISDATSEGTANFLRTAGDIVSKLSIVSSIASALGLIDKALVIGDVTLSFDQSFFKTLIAIAGPALSLCKKTAESYMSLESTGMILEHKDSSYTEHLLVLAADLTSQASQLIYSLLLRLRINSTLSTLWEGIKARSNMQRGPTGLITAVPCFSSTTELLGALVVGSTIAASVRIATYRADQAAAVIGVLSDKKHTADVINVYNKDREIATTLSRLTTLAISACCAVGEDNSYRIAGVSCAAAVILDWATGSANSVGMSYRFSHVLTRLRWSPNRIETAVHSVLSWWMGESTVACGVNAIILTGESIKTSFRERAVMRKRMFSAMKEAQQTEADSNRVLMDFTLDADIAYKKAKTIMLGEQKMDEFDFYNKDRWDIDEDVLSNYLNLSAVARRETVASVSRDGDITRQMRSLTINQCRYLGRTRKLVWDKREKDPSEEGSNQSSMLFLDNELWRGVVDPSDLIGWEAAADSRFAVLFAIAERNDGAIRLDVSNEDLMICANIASATAAELSSARMKVVTNSLGMDWWTILRNANEKSTSGIIARKRTGQALTAGFLAFYGKRCELAKEMIVDGSVNSEMNVINVFAKRRIEKVKTSMITGIECVITRTIQASEAETKIANIESFLLFDKILKITRMTTGIAVGMNYFSEFSEDDFNVKINSMKQLPSEEKKFKRLRVSLDHSSFDGSQRNWSIEMMKKIRSEFARISSSDKTSKKAFLSYLDHCYDHLKIRVMVTTAGDLFALTGQQMSGHATTSSDNSVKSLVYAKAVEAKLSATRKFSICTNSLRVQGDDTRFDVIVSKTDDNEEMKRAISSAMGELGQVVKLQKIEITEACGTCNFLSHWSEMRVYRVEKNGSVWSEIHNVPMRNIEDIFGMVATTLKATKDKGPKKSKKDISLMAAKAMSFLMMYGTDFYVAYLTCTIIWASFKLLEAMKFMHDNVSIRDSWLPWFATQSGLTGEFEVKIRTVFEMHSISRPESGVRAAGWIINADKNMFKLIVRIWQLQTNFKRIVRGKINWEWKKLNDAFKSVRTPIDKDVRVGSISWVDEAMSEIAKAVKLKIDSSEMSFKPYADMKAEAERLVAKRVNLTKNEITSVSIITREEQKRDGMITIKTVRKFNMKNPIVQRLTIASDDGIIVRDMVIIAEKITDNTVKGHVIVEDVETALLTGVRPWNITEIVAVSIRKNKMDILRGARRMSSKNIEMDLIDERSCCLLREHQWIQHITEGKIILEELRQALSLRISNDNMNKSPYRKMMSIVA